MILEQLDLFHSADLKLSAIERDFSLKVEKKVKIILTRNRSHLISVRKNGQHSVHLRVQEIFLNAPQDIWDAIGTFMVSPTTESRRAIRTFISGYRAAPDLNETYRRPKLNGAGEHYDLNLLFNEINREYFNSEVRCQITWGKSYKKRRKRSISFGNFESFSNLIKINPALDQVKVPGFFIRYIVYHEMLHAKIENTTPAPSGRKLHHSGAFCELEKGFKEYHQAIDWEKRNIHLFIK
ncbi:MAG: hypothetical protein HY200_01155 [Nitrospirae bacterium]|nr:hypothetical protein [Nitrospirota bacterium]MBI3593544.1 hypothetical protein [Nitrospirota bacterium]